MCGVSNIKHVKSRPREKEARELLEKLADQVRFSVVVVERVLDARSRRTHPCLRRQIPTIVHLLR